MKQRTLAMVAIVSLFFLAGCGDKGPTRYPVSGKVVFQGQPLDQGNIQFLTKTQPPIPSGGAPVKDGSYSLPRDHGLEAGAYRVILTSPVPMKNPPVGMSSPPTKERMPPRYSSFEKGDVSIEVTASGPNTFDFTIE